MALDGTIGDFGLPDILQLIGLQRKTAVLHLENKGEQVTVKFLLGDVVSAETGSESIEDRLGQVLVRTGKITETQLNQAIGIQKKTLQRLGHILVRNGHITEEDLVEALRVQSMQILFRLFRWREGRYQVRMVDTLDYDEQHATPISSETLLMEGARMVDEWPIIERRIRSDKIVFERTEAAAALDIEPASLVDTDIDFDFIFEGGEGAEAEPEPDDDEVSLSPDERQVLALIDGRRSAAEVNDRSSLGEFDTFRILAELLTRDLIREAAVAAVAAPGSGATSRRLEGVGAVAAGLVLAAVGLASIATLDGNPFTPWRLSGSGPSTEQLRLYAAQARLERIEQAVQVFYYNEASFPEALLSLAALGYIAADDLLDPWGRSYGYELSAGGYRIYGHDPAGEPSPELTRAHRFSSAQQMIVDSSRP